MEVVVHANYIGLCRFYRYVVNISRWSPYEGGQLDRFYCIYKERTLGTVSQPASPPARPAGRLSVSIPEFLDGF